MINPNSYAVVSGTLIHNRIGEFGKRAKLFASTGNPLQFFVSEVTVYLLYRLRYPGQTMGWKCCLHTDPLNLGLTFPSFCHRI